MLLCHITLELLPQLRLDTLFHRSTLERSRPRPRPRRRSPATLVSKLEEIERTLHHLLLHRLTVMSPGMRHLTFKTSKSSKIPHMISLGTDLMVLMRLTTPMSCLATTRTHPIKITVLCPDKAHKSHIIDPKILEAPLATRLLEHRLLPLTSHLLGVAT